MVGFKDAADKAAKQKEIKEKWAREMLSAIDKLISAPEDSSYLKENGLEVEFEDNRIGVGEKVSTDPNEILSAGIAPTWVYLSISEDGGLDIDGEPVAKNWTASQIYEAFVDKVRSECGLD